jgi:hypothetical protein
MLLSGRYPDPDSGMKMYLTGWILQRFRKKTGDRGK